jgi:hypothetical protein
VAHHLLAVAQHVLPARRIAPSSTRQIDGERTLGLRTLQAPQSVSVAELRGHRPAPVRVRVDRANVAGRRTAVLRWPVPAVTHAWETPERHFWFALPYFNPGTVDIWPEWDVTGGRRGCCRTIRSAMKAYGRGVRMILGKTSRSRTAAAGGELHDHVAPGHGAGFSRSGRRGRGCVPPGFNIEYPIVPGGARADAGARRQAASSAASAPMTAAWVTF